MKFLAGRTTRVLPRTLGTLVQSDSKVRLPKDNAKVVGTYFEGKIIKRDVSTTNTNLFNRSQSQHSKDLKRFLEEVRTKGQIKALNVHAYKYLRFLFHVNSA